MDEARGAKKTRILDITNFLRIPKMSLKHHNPLSIDVPETTNAMIQKVNTLEKLLEIRTDRLERLRILETSRSDQLTQQETRTLETKLVKMFAELLLTKQKLPESSPSSDLQQWLRIVGKWFFHFGRRLSELVGPIQCLLSAGRGIWVVFKELQ